MRTQSRQMAGGADTTFGPCSILSTKDEDLPGSGEMVLHRSPRSRKGAVRGAVDARAAALTGEPSQAHRLLHGRTCGGGRHSYGRIGGERNALRAETGVRRRDG